MAASLWQRWKRLRAELVYRFDGQRVTVVKGKGLSGDCSELREILSRSGAPICEIHVLPTGRVEFDKAVPPDAHQAIRNVLCSK